MRQIVFNTDEILQQLSTVSSIVSNKTPLPVLADVRIEVKNDADSKPYLVLTTSDSEIWMQVKTQCVSASFLGAFCVEVKGLINALRNLGGKEVTMELDDVRHIVCCDYGEGQFTLALESANEFPNYIFGVGDKKEKTVDSQILLRAIMFTEDAVSTSEIRPVMNGIHFDFFSDRMVSAALDHVKFAKYTNRSIKDENEAGSGFTLPIKAARVMTQILAKKTGDFRIVFNDSNIMLLYNDFILVSRQQEGVYPKYDQLLRNKPTKEVTISKDDVMTALKRVMPLGRSDSERATFDFSDGCLTISVEDIDFSRSAVAEIPCEYNDEPLAIGLKGGVVAAMLSNIDDDNVIFKMTSPTLPVIIEPCVSDGTEEYVSLIMPMILPTASNQNQQ